MLIQFQVGNFASFKDVTTFSMVKSSMRDRPENIIKVDDDLELLKSAVIYGANASGKSNFLRALGFMKLFITYSFGAYQEGEEIGVDSFLLNEKTSGASSFFEIVFVAADNIRYRYGFQVDNKKVRSEWLYRTPKTKEEELFLRDEESITVSDNFIEGKGQENKARNNCLFLSMMFHFKGTISTAISEWFVKFRAITRRDYKMFLDRTLYRLEKEPVLKEDIFKFMAIADNGVTGLEVKDIDESVEPVEGNAPPAEKKRLRKFKRKDVYFFHRVFDENKQLKNEIKLLSDAFESEGTKKMFALSVPVIDALRNGEIIVIDELENHLHPLLLEHIIQLFNSGANKNGAQLIFATHNTTCMNKECFRRDQIWFTEKNKFGESSLFSLADYKLDDKKIRSDATYDKDYLLGKYGAVPFIDDIDLNFDEAK